MRGGEKVLEAICRIFPDADLLTLVHVPGSVSPIDRTPRHPHVVRPAPAAPGAVLPALSAALPDRHRGLRSRRRRSGDLDEPLRGQVGRADGARACTSATATRRCATRGTSSTRTSGRSGSGRSASALARPVLAWLARWDGPRRSRVDRFVANRDSLPGGSRGTIIVRRRCSIRRWTPSSSPPVRTAGAPISWWCPPSSRTSASTWRFAPPRGWGPSENRRRRARSGATAGDGGSDRRISRHARRWVASRASTRRAQALRAARRKRTSASPRSKRMACGRPVVALGRGGAHRNGRADGVTGVLVDDRTAEAFRRRDGTSVSRRVRRPRAARRATPRFRGRRGSNGLHARSCSTLRPWQARHAEALQPAAGRDLRRRRLPGRGVCVRARLLSSASTAGCLPLTQRPPPFRAVPRHRAVHRAARRRWRSSCRASTGCAAGARAWTTSSACSSAASSAALFGVARHAVRPDVPPERVAQGRRVSRGLARRLGALPRRSTCSSRTPRAKSCATCSAAGGARASASSAC